MRRSMAGSVAPCDLRDMKDSYPVLIGYEARTIIGAVSSNQLPTQNMVHFGVLRTSGMVC